MRLEAGFALTASADLERRTITGTLAPYGEQGNASLGPVIFAAGSLTFRDHVPLLMGHDHERPVGLLSSLVDDGTKVTGTFSIPETPGGDQALLEAAAGLRNGLSVGVDINAHTYEGDTLVVTAADAYETSLVTFPAFSSARVSKVAASETPVTIPVSDTTQESESVVTETPTVVEAAAPVPVFVPTVKVQDGFPYRQGGQFSFFKDMLAAGQNPDAASRHNIATTMMNAAADTTTNIAEIIPTAYRPDLYVGQLTVPRPVIDAFFRGTLDGPNPLRIPKFVSATGLSADHVEGVNPATGNVDTAEQVLTPKAISGVYDATREMIEGSTPAVDQIILNAMRQEYASETEAYAVTTFLAGATAGTVVDISNGVTMQLLARMITFQANRKQAPDVFLAGTTLFPEIIAQIDSTGRPLNPYVGAMNAPGTSGARVLTANVQGMESPFVQSMVDGLLGLSTDAVTLEGTQRFWRWEEVAGPATIRLSHFNYIVCGVIRATGLLKFATQA
jgi:HK97 family phage prohead protease